MINPVTTKYLFRCQCGQKARFLEPDIMICPNCGEVMELSYVQKLYPGFGIGSMNIRTFLKADAPAKPLDDEGDYVV